ncbi:hypothetical protein B0H13DRAFT_320147 [Mycena leptocephala]|nr:hypothetical protein B0H13DRAFT_320147 [Mycena leptocephala]
MFMATRASLVAVVKGYKGPCKLRCYLVRGPPLVLHSPLSFHFFFPMSSDPTRPPFSQKTAPPVQTGAVPPSQSSMAPASFPGIQYDNSGRPWFRGPGGEWIGSSHFQPNLQSPQQAPFPSQLDRSAQSAAQFDFRPPFPSQRHASATQALNFLPAGPSGHYPPVVDPLLLPPLPDDEDLDLSDPATIAKAWLKPHQSCWCSRQRHQGEEAPLFLGFRQPQQRGRAPFQVWPSQGVAELVEGGHQETPRSRPKGTSAWTKGLEGRHGAFLQVG